MITISDGKLTIPEGQRFIGFTGDNRHTRKIFCIRQAPESGWIYRLYLTFDDGRHNFFVLPATVSSEGTTLIWDIDESHILKSGLVKAQIKAFSENQEVYHTTSDVFVAGKSTEEDEEFKNGNSEFLLYEKTLNELYRKMQNASAKMPFVGENGHWYTYNAVSEKYEDSGVSTSVNIGNGVVTPQNLDREYWQKYERINVSGYDYFDAILQDESPACAIYRVEFSGLSPVKNQVGEGSFIAFTSYNCDGLLLLNVSTGELWTYRKGAHELEPVKYDGHNLLQGSVADDSLEYDYFRRIERVSMTSFADFDAILSEEWSYQAIYRMEFSGLSPLKSILGEGSFIGFADRSNNTLLIINILSGQRWIYTKNSNTLTSAEKEPDVAVINNVYELSTLSSYNFQNRKIYMFNTAAELQAVFGQGLCVALLDGYSNTKLLIYNLKSKENFEFGLSDKTVVKLNNITTSDAATVSLALNSKREYRYSNPLATLDVTLSTNTEDDFECSLAFRCGDTPTVFSCPSFVKWSGDDVAAVIKNENGTEVKYSCLVPQNNKVYNVIFWYDGINMNAVARGVMNV